MVALVVRTRKLTHFQTAVAKANLRLQLGASQQRIGGVTNTRGVVVALVIVGEGTPLGACVDAALREDAAAGATDGVSSAELLDEIGRHLATIRAHQSDVEVLRPLFGFDRLGGLLIDLAGREHAAIWRVRHVASHDGLII